MASYYSRNKTELLTLTGAIYSFVAYLTAFALEVLFVIDLTKLPGASEPYDELLPPTSAPSFIHPNGSLFSQATDIDGSTRLPMDADKSHLLITCVAISILYFIVFVASLLLIVALILRSCLCILIWLCISTTTYLPELGLNVYSAAFGWGLESRNGKLEIAFYALRAVLNVIFVIKAHKLYKEWYYEKNFFRLKCASRVAGYDSPYFIGRSDSLSTTINPVFTESNYDLRTLPNNHHNYQGLSMGAKLRRYTAEPSLSPEGRRQMYDHQLQHSTLHYPHSTFGFYQRGEHLQNHHSVSSLTPSPRFSHLKVPHDYLGDDLEMNLDYRTLTRPQSNASTLGKSIAASQLSYSTQSLDRRQLGSEPDHNQVVLRPLEHQPFEYLKRPGSTPGDLYKLEQVNSRPISSYTSKLQYKM